MKEYLRKRFVRYILTDVFSTITKEDVLRIADGKWTWKGKEMNDETIEVLKVQAKTFQHSTLWRILKAELEWLAVKTLMEKGKDGQDIRAAQLLGYLTKVVDEKLSTISDERG